MKGANDAFADALRELGRIAPQAVHDIYAMVAEIAEERDEARAKLASERNEARARRRRTAQILIEAIGAPGPENCEDTARRAVAKIERLREELDEARAEVERLRSELDAKSALLADAVIAYHELKANERDNGVGEIEAYARMLQLARATARRQGGHR